VKELKKKGWRIKPVFQAMYRWSFSILLLIGLVIFGIYLLLGHGENMMADPFAYLADILVRSLVGPLIIIPCLIAYYHEKLEGEEYLNDATDDDVSCFAALTFVVAVVSGLICFLAGRWDAVIYFSPIVFFGIMGIFCGLFESLPALVIVKVLVCFFYLIIGACSTILTCVYFMTSGFVAFFLTEWIMNVCRDFSGSSRAHSMAQRIRKWFLPEVEKES